MTNPTLSLGDNKQAHYRKWIGFDVAGAQKAIKGPLEVESSDSSVATVEVDADGLGVIIKASQPPKLESCEVTIVDGGYNNKPSCILEVTIASEGEHVIAPDGTTEITELV